MFQIIQGLNVYVVELKSFPPQFPVNARDDITLMPYAQALNIAIEQKIVKKPGKYAIHVDPRTMTWNIFEVQE